MSEDRELMKSILKAFYENGYREFEVDTIGYDVYDAYERDYRFEHNFILKFYKDEEREDPPRWLEIGLLFNREGDDSDWVIEEFGFAEGGLYKLEPNGEFR